MAEAETVASPSILPGAVEKTFDQMKTDLDNTV